MTFPKAASRLLAQKVSLHFKSLALLRWELEATFFDSGILLLSPVSQWDLDRAGSKYTGQKALKL